MMPRPAMDATRRPAYTNPPGSGASPKSGAASPQLGVATPPGGGRSATRDAAGRGDRAGICAKLDDLRHNYALRVTVEWVQALDLYVPVQRFCVLIRRRKGERVIALDWHPLLKTAELPLCQAGLGLDRVRLVCDDKLHLTQPAGQRPCPSCGKPFCRACHPACPRCSPAN